MPIERKTLPEQPYLYVERTAGYADIAAAMGSGFGAVFGFVHGAGITPLGMPMTVYVEMPSGDTLSFRSAVFVTSEDAARASGEIKAASIPAGEAFTTTHVGAYQTIDQAHKALWAEMDAQGAPKSDLVWEIYIDDPGETPEQTLRTEVYRAVSA